MIHDFIGLTATFQPRKRRKLSRHIPEELYAPGKRDVEIVTVNDIHYDYTLLSAQLELNRADPTFIVGPGSSPSLPSLLYMNTRVFRSSLHAICYSDAFGSAEQVQHRHVHGAHFGRRHERTLCPPYYPVPEAIQTSEQHPVWPLLLNL